MDDLHIAQLIHAFDPPSMGTDVPRDIAHVLSWDLHIQIHDRLDQLRARFLEGFLETFARGDLEGDVFAVDVVIFPVDQTYAHIHDRDARPHAFGHFADHAFFARRNELPWNH